MALSQWIDGDESAAEMLARVLKVHTSLFVPPLHRVPLRVGNVVELIGPAGSAKTQILIQVQFSSSICPFYLLSSNWQCRWNWWRFTSKAFEGNLCAIKIRVASVSRLQLIAFFPRSGMGCPMEAWGVLWCLLTWIVVLTSQGFPKFWSFEFWRPVTMVSYMCHLILIKF